ncbi:CDP-alcohol phosphatidyltransferase family protein [Methanospirillum hungatei]|jgi:archaetidylinositol phosphate synthase|uniref:CDP-alcohol phosphatidyltransferase family protein n=1 Tax=Methanospirillum hungatei TaxID=2203 RepID=UPI001B66FEC4|nr:CDP-alcohol phosphatidyltransferase family protein [Methanospirillum hungatei]MBP9007755.1 CDP-alcohol phosphatidyltransferase family protein [Methanospirillum sp.]MCA1915663.1 CDP-alcohol phosphatidyltransferase family protein [Methanospirillum hungatei]HOW04892.1 CDP-alcohol phosphatidyltransferase family protein [Methanospirillum hungatei]
MNITAFRYRFIRYLEPIAEICKRAGLSPNIITIFSILTGCFCSLSYILHSYFIGSLFLFCSAILDLVDGSVARMTGRETRFGAVFDWIADKYVDTIVLLGVGLSGIPIISGVLKISPVWDFGIVAVAIIGSMMNTFIKPVTYAEIGFTERKEGKIDDPLEGIGFFGRPETVLVLVLGGLTGFIWISVLIIALCTNLSALQRIVYLYRRYS